MTKKISTMGAAQAAIDVFLLAFYAFAGLAGVMIASITRDYAMWFYFGVGIFMLFTSLRLVSKVTKPMDNYETTDVE